VRVDFEGASDQKASWLDRAGCAVFPKQKSRNQEAAEDEKQVHADPAKVRKQERPLRVAAEHQDDRNRPKAIQCRIAHIRISTLTRENFLDDDGSSNPQGYGASDCLRSFY
jgi:hypothetical protein